MTKYTLNGNPASKVLIAILNYRRERKVSPSLADIADMVGMGKTTVFYHVRRLYSSGALMARIPGQSRSYVPSPEMEKLYDYNNSRIDQPDPQSADLTSGAESG